MVAKSRYNPQSPLWQWLLPSVALIVLGTAGFLLMLDAVLERDDFTHLDQPLLDRLVSARTPWLTAVLTVVTNIFGPIILPTVVGLGALAWAVRRKSWRDPGLLVGAIALSSGIAIAVKLVVERPRPAESLQVIPGLETSFSFPSGHTTGAATLILVWAYLLWRQHRGGRLLAAWIVGSAAIIGIVGLSRLYLGYHFLSDVVAGTCLGVVVLGVVIAVSRWLDRRAWFGERAADRGTDGR